MTIIGSKFSRIFPFTVFFSSRSEPMRAGEIVGSGRRPSVPAPTRIPPARRARRMVLGALVACGVGLSACGGGGGGASVELVPVATKVQVSTNGFSFPNFPASAYPIEFDAQDVVSMFGSGPAVCVGGKAEGCVLTAEAAAFARMVNQSRSSGHCEGLAVVALNRFDTAAEPPTVKLPDQQETIKTIMRAFATQFIPEAQQEIESWLGKSLDEKIAALVESFKKEKLSFTLGVYIDSGGHTVMPYAVEFPSKDLARIMVYDTNWPGKNRFVDVDLKAKTWSFSFSGADPENDPDKWTGGPADMDLTSFSSRAGTCPFCGDGTKADSTTMLVRTSNLDWSVEADGQVLEPGVEPAAGSGVVVKPVKGGLLTELGFVGMRDKRATYDYMIRIPNKPKKAGQKKTRSKLKFSGTTSLFAVTPTGIAQVNTPGNPNIPVEVGENSIVSQDPAVQLTLASGNLVATASGPSASLETSASGNLEVAVTAANGQVVTQAVTPEAPAAKVVADNSGGVVALVASTTGEVVKREVSSTGVETKTTSTESLDLNATTFKAPPGLESKPIEALPSLEKRNLANPEYKADAPYVAPTTTTSIATAAKANASEPKKTVVGKFVVEPAEFGDAPFSLTEPTSNSSAPFTYTSSEPTVATVNPTTGRVTIVGVGSTMITASQEATTGYTSSSITTFFRVAKATPKVGTFTVPKKTFGDPAFTVTAPTSTNSAPFVFDSSNDAVAKVNASTGRVSIVGAGSVTITASQPASANFEAVERKATLTVTKAALAFTVATQSDVTFGTADFTLAVPTSPSTGTYTYATTTPEVVSVDASTGSVRVVGAGAASIRVTQNASANYEASTQTVAFTVRKAIPRLGVFAIEPRSFGTAAFSAPAPSSPSPGTFAFASSDASVATVTSGGTVTLVGAGSTTITVDQAATANYEAASAAATLTVTKGTPTLTVTNPPDKPYGSADFTVPKPVTNSTGVITYTSLTPSIATVNSATGLVRLIGTGNASIEVNLAATNNHVSATRTMTFVAQKALPTYGAFVITAREIGDSDFTLTPPTSTSPAPFTFTSSDQTVATVTTDGLVSIVGGGSTTITASQVSTANFNASSTTGVLTVNRTAPTFGTLSVDNPTLTPGLIGKRYVGYFNDDPNWFDTAALHGDTNVMTDFTRFTSNADSYSWEWKGSFRSSAAGVYTFCTASDDASYIWIGDAALSGASPSNSVVNNGGGHGVREICNTITLAASTNYPYRVSYGEGGGGDEIQMYFTPPGGQQIRDGVGYYFSRNGTQVGDANYTIAAPTSNSSGVMTFTSSNPSVASVNSLTGEVTVLTAGTTTITVNQAAAGSYAAGSVSKVLVVEKGDQATLAAVPTTCALGGECAVGDVGPGGGTVIYVANADFTSGASCGSNCRYLEVAPATWNGGVSDADNQLAWGCPDVSVTGTGTAIGAGFANTAAMANACATATSAAKVVRSSTSGRLSDWYIPSRDEAAAVYAQRGIISGYEASSAYWTSSQTSMTNALAQSGATVADAGKTTLNYVRPIRAFSATNTSKPYRSLVIPMKVTGGSGTGAVSLQLISAGSANCSLSNDTITATQMGKCTVKAVRAGDANYVNGASAPTVLAFYGSPVAQIVGGYHHTCSVSDAGKVACWGNNNWGAFGVGTTTSSPEPIAISSMGWGAASMSLGYYHSCAVTSNAGLKCWGYNGNGQLGIGNTNSQYSPVDVAGVTTPILQVVTGAEHTCALTTAGGVKCWGWNGYGQLGDGTTTNRTLPVDVIGLTSGVKFISAGYGSTCAVLDDGRVKCWGDNRWGQLGDGTNNNRSYPAFVTGATGVATVSNGTRGACLVTMNGAAKCWGHNGWGDIGNSTNNASAVPVAVTGLQTGVAKITNGEGHACAQMTTGAVKCWGRNDRGQLGIGNTQNMNVPTDVVGLTSHVSSLSAGNVYQTCAVVKNSGVKCWGWNNWGQLGDGTYVNRLTPVDVSYSDGGYLSETAIGALSLPQGTFTTQTPSFTLSSPTSNRQVPFSFSSSNPNVATVNQVTGQVNIVAAGRTVLAASQAGNGAYNAATSKVTLDVYPYDATGELSTCQMGAICSVGDIGPGGGRIFAVDSNDQYDGIDYWEVAPTDTAAANSWCDSTNAGTSVTSTNANFGAPNMQKILGTCTSGAAFDANDYAVNGITDWYLPSKNELLTVVSGAGSFVASSSAPYTPLSTANSYWSSSEASTVNAVAVAPSTALSADDVKTAMKSVRPVRAFASIFSTPAAPMFNGLAVAQSQVEYVQAPFFITRPTSQSSGLILYASSNSSVASIDQYSGKITVTGVGSVSFTATQPAWAGFPSASQTVAMTVIKSTPTLSGFTYGNTSFRTGGASVSATAPTSASNGVITYTSSNTAVATVNSTTGAITPVATGFADITATQAATSNWNPTTQVISISVARSCADGGACIVGDTGPGGGIVFYVAPTSQTWGRYLEAATQDLGSVSSWCNSASTNVAEATSTALGAGAANTAAIAAACTSSAANAVDALTQGGKSDWYLPSSLELSEMYTKKQTIGGFANEPYWSSTQISTGNARRIDFLGGTTMDTATDGLWRVRPIRAIVGPADGLTEATAGTSASQLQIDNGYSGSGNYWIKPAGYSGSALQLWCEFDKSGGGWVLIGKGRHSNDVSGGWFGTENEIDVAGLTQENAFSAGVSKVSSTFVNYLMNGSANGWTNSSSRNYLVVNRINNALDGYTNGSNVFVPYGGVGDSFSLKVETDTQFKWIDQFGSTGQNRFPQMANGTLKRFSGTWLGGSLTNNALVRLFDNFENDARRLFTWQWDGHQGNHGWSAGQNIGAGQGFVAGNEGHALQFVQLWAR